MLGVYYYYYYYYIQFLQCFHDYIKSTIHVGLERTYSITVVSTSPIISERRLDENRTTSSTGPGTTGMVVMVAFALPCGGTDLQNSACHHTGVNQVYTGRELTGHPQLHLVHVPPPAAGTPHCTTPYPEGCGKIPPKLLAGRALDHQKAS